MAKASLIFFLPRYAIATVAFVENNILLLITLAFLCEATGYTYFQIFCSCSIYLNGVSQVALMLKNPLANAGDTRNEGLIPGWGRSPGGRHGNPLQYSCLENIPWTKEPDQLWFTGLQRVGHDWSDLARTHTFTWMFILCGHVWKWPESWTALVTSHTEVSRHHAQHLAQAPGTWPSSVSDLASWVPLPQREQRSHN